MAAYHIEAGARIFIDFAKRMITDMGDDIRPYLKSIYSSARHFPGMEEYKKAMTPESEYDEIDINDIKLEEDGQAGTDKTPVKKASAKGNMQKTDNAEGFGDLFSGVNEVSLQTETLNRTDNEQERGSERRRPLGIVLPVYEIRHLIPQIYEIEDREAYLGACRGDELVLPELAVVEMAGPIAHIEEEIEPYIEPIHSEGGTREPQVKVIHYRELAVIGI